MSSAAGTPDLEGKSSKELHAAGGRAYGARDYAAAVAYLSRASEAGVADAGGDPLADALGATYLLYGKALLELSREDGDPLGEDVPKDVAVGKDETADGDGPDDAEDDAEDDGEEDGEDNDGEGDEGEGEKIDEDNEKNEQREEASSGKEGESSGVEFNGEKKREAGVEKMDEEPGDETTEKDDEPTDLQVAWEVLELAKVIFTKRGDSGKMDLADTLLTLGEISMESENPQSAISDMQEAIKLLKTEVEENSRALAEAYYKLGMACFLAENTSEATEHYNTSKEILLNRIKSLENSEKAMHKREVEEMKNIIPEIDEKVADLKNYNEEQIKVTEELNKSPVKTPEKKATDISHLVKRKRKSEDDGSAGPSKKPALDSSDN